jgi:cobalt transporter subunit CbtA
MPGAGAAELAQRQTWWLLTVAASAAGIGLIAWGNMAMKIVGVALIAAPHLIGAPEPEAFAGVVPPELSGLFAVRVLAVGAVGWAALGAIAGHFWSREQPTA